MALANYASLCVYAHIRVHLYVCAGALITKSTFPRGVDTKACYAFVLAFVNLQA
jgi:hypothetical protein